MLNPSGHLSFKATIAVILILAVPHTPADAAKSLKLPHDSSGRPVYLGLLKKRQTPGGAAFTHGIYFKSEAARVNGLKVAEFSRIPPGEGDRKLIREAPTPDAFITFDGKSIGKIKLQGDPGIVKLQGNAETIDRKFNWLKKEKRPGVLITTSRDHFSDPEGWHVAPLPLPTPERSEIYNQLIDLTTGCLTASGSAPAKVTFDDFEIKKVYRPKLGKNALIQIQPSKCVRWAKIKETASFEQTHSIWLYKSAHGWNRKFGAELVDIGDFDGGGKSSALFYANDESTVPAGEAELYQLESFEKIAQATDQGY